MSSGHRFLWKCVVCVFDGNCWLNSYGKFGGATRRRFFANCEKPEKEVDIRPPPGRARVNIVVSPPHQLARVGAGSDPAAGQGQA